jgi:CRISPR/Cas system endoribonuclease Cas6 (RAMP superfamily)
MYTKYLYTKDIYTNIRHFYEMIKNNLKTLYSRVKRIAIIKPDDPGVFAAKCCPPSARMKPVP